MASCGRDEPKSFHRSLVVFFGSSWRNRHGRILVQRRVRAQRQPGWRRVEFNSTGHVLRRYWQTHPRRDRRPLPRRWKSWAPMGPCRTARAGISDPFPRATGADARSQNLCPDRRGRPVAHRPIRSHTGRPPEHDRVFVPRHVEYERTGAAGDGRHLPGCFHATPNPAPSQAPVNAATVRIKLSLDSGDSFPYASRAAFPTTVRL
jgi:hypothetical protein